LNDHPLDFQDVREAFIGSTFTTVKFKDGTRTISRLTNHTTDTDWIGPDHLPKHATSEWGEEMLNSLATYIVACIEEFEKVVL